MIFLISAILGTDEETKFMLELMVENLETFVNSPTNSSDIFILIRNPFNEKFGMKRTVDQIRKRWHNIHQKAKKEKADPGLAARARNPISSTSPSSIYDSDWVYRIWSSVFRAQKEIGSKMQLIQEKDLAKWMLDPSLEGYLLGWQKSF